MCSVVPRRDASFQQLMLKYCVQLHPEIVLKNRLKEDRGQQFLTLLDLPLLILMCAMDIYLL